jgi:hypothetical protein
VLKRGDIIKLGRVVYKIKDYKIENAINPLDQKECPSEEPPVDIQEAFGTPEAGDTCRFCHGEENTPGNPLFSICKCSGSMRFIHLNCVKTWIAVKLTTKKQGYLTTYYWKTFECEICKHSYPCKGD